MSNRFISPPHLSEGSNQYLSIDSTLGELPLYSFQVPTTCLGIEVARIFDKYPRLPGAILIEQGKFCGMISRYRLLEHLLRPHRLELFLHKPLHILYNYARTEVLVLADRTPILVAAQQALRRPPELLGEPIVVKTEADTYQLLDVNELNIAHWQIRGIETQVRYERTQAQMIQSEKMASLGRLVDGVAHEILDPVGFIWGNLTYISMYSDNLMQVISAYEERFAEIPAEIQQLKEEVEFDFLEEDLPRAINSIKAGAERLKKLAVSLQNFCHIDEVYPKPADLHGLLDSIILLLKSRLSSEIEVIKNYGNLPPVTCFAGQLNQVFINILTNAVDALLNESAHQEFASNFSTAMVGNTNEKPCIEITTQVCSLEPAPKPDQLEQRWVSIKIADNGPGLSPKAQKQILESFSIAKRSEKETSLACSFRIVTAKHGGKLLMRSELGKGTEFEIILPLI